MRACSNQPASAAGNTYTAALAKKEAGSAGAPTTTVLPSNATAVPLLVKKPVALPLSLVSVSGTEATAPVIETSSKVRPCAAHLIAILLLIVPPNLPWRLRLFVRGV